MINFLHRPHFTVYRCEGGATCHSHEISQSVPHGQNKVPPSIFFLFEKPFHLYNSQ